jgi:hypothetical protein
MSEKPREVTCAPYENGVTLQATAEHGLAEGTPRTTPRNEARVQGNALGAHNQTGLP